MDQRKKVDEGGLGDRKGRRSRGALGGWGRGWSLDLEVFGLFLFPCEYFDFHLRAVFNVNIYYSPYFKLGTEWPWR